MKRRYYLIFIICLLSFCNKINAQDYVTYLKNSNQINLLYNLRFYEDPSNKLGIEDIINIPGKFIEGFPHFTKANTTYWVRYKIINETNTDLLLNVQNPLLDRISFYEIINNKIHDSVSTGDLYPYYSRPIDNENFLFNLSIRKNDTATYYLKIRGKEQIVLPVSVTTKDIAYQKVLSNDLLNGMYFGLIIVIVLYNAFIFLSTKDSSYIYYILYVLFIGLSQAALNGYTFKYFWPNSPSLQNEAILIFPCIAGIAAIFFSKLFLHIKRFTPLLNKGLNIFIVIYSFAIFFSVLNYRDIAFNIINFAALFISLYGFLFSFIIARKGFRPAKFFLIAWSFFLASLIIYVFRNIGFIESNLLNNNILEIGSGFEAILLSFALADKINAYKKEKEDSQKLALSMSLENERITREQNIILEEKVKIRTEELQTANSSLNIAMKDLKDAQSQLVDAEKMASLGQLTAGIAHEINNPINFVKSNIRPLQLDISDLLEVIKKYEELDGHDNISEKLKEIKRFTNEIDLAFINTEIDTLIKGIEEGATRTAEIVKGLRTFSRLDESELKSASIHEGIDSTIILLRNALPDNITIEKQYGELPVIECLPGKLNQVFMNILNNAIYAIKEKNTQQQEKIVIKTRTADDQEHIIISITDTGIGMSPQVKERIFEPFFTTKDVGEGTGLGLSIVFSIIEKHHGKIIVNSERGKGSEFIISLPILQKDLGD